MFFYFSPYILFLPLLVPKPINALHFSPWKPILSPINGETDGINKFFFFFFFYTLVNKIREEIRWSQAITHVKHLPTLTYLSGA